MTSVLVADARYAIAGFTNSFGMGGDDFHLLTLNGGLSRPECVIDTVPPHDSIPVIYENFIGEPNILDQYDPFPLEDTMVMYTEICTLMTGAMESQEKEFEDDIILYTSFEYIAVRIRETGRLSANLYDVTGRNIAGLAQGVFDTGTHLLVIPKNIGAGVYFVRLDFNGMLRSAKLVRFQ